MNERFLPIGTVVLLKGATKKLMITSYLIFTKGENEDKVMYDYGGCPYPEGIIESNFAVGFNHDKIDKVIHVGYTDDEGRELKQALLDSEEEIKEKFKESN